MATITTPDGLKGYAVTTVDFEDIASLDGMQFGFQAGQPYAILGLSFSPATVDSTANLNSASSKVGVRSDIVYDAGNENFLRWQFSLPQKAVGFFYRDLLATSVKVRAYNTNLNLIEEGTFQGGDGYAGFIRGKADITEIQVQSPHDTVNHAYVSRTYMDDLSFATTGWLRNRLIIRRLTWIWTILIGYTLLTPIGPICIVCDSPMGDFWVRLLGIGALVLGGIGLWSELRGARTR